MKRHILSCALLMNLFFSCSAADDLEETQKIKLIFKAVRNKDHVKMIALVDSEYLANLTLELAGTSSGFSIEIIQPLLEKGACPNERFREHHCHRETLLGVAIKSRTPQAQHIPTLIALGADPNLPNAIGETPLHICVQFIENSATSRFFQEILMLLHHGANPLVQNSEGKTPRESIPDHSWFNHSKESQKIADLLEQAEQRYLHRERIQMIRNQGIPPRNFKMEGKKIPEHLLAAASSSSESHSALLSKSWPEKTVLQ